MPTRQTNRKSRRAKYSSSRPRRRATRVLLPLTALLATQAPLGVGGQTSMVKGVNAQVSARRRGDIKIRFVDTDVSEVLQALSLRTGSNIIYSGMGAGGATAAMGTTGGKRLISINVTASNTDEALRYITSASGLAFRQVGNSYVVAPAAGLKQAIEPLGEQARVPLTSMSPGEAVKTIEGAFPYVTARPAGTAVLLIGSPDDLQQAQALLQDQDKSLVPDPNTTEVVALTNIPANQATALLKSLYPALKVESIGDPTRPGGTLGLAGRRSQINRAKESISSADGTAGSQAPDHVFRIYNIKYSSARTLRVFLQGAAPRISVLTGPESYTPPRPTFNPITGATLGTASTGVGGTTSGASNGGTVTGNVTDLGANSGFNPVTDPGGATTGNTSTTPQRGEVNDRAKTLILSGTTRDVDEVVALLNRVDVPPQQVMIEVKVIDVTPQFNDAIGLQYGFAPIGINNAPSGTTVDTVTGQQTPNILRPTDFATFGRFGPGFAAQINAVATRTNSKLLANPRVQVIDNDDASIFIGDTIRTQISQSGISGTTIQVLEFPVGIILLVRPRINADGRVTLRIHPVVSTVTSFGAGNIPNTSNREAETTVMMQDGETIVIGGLIRDEMSKSIQEVPVLARIPFLGELFKYRTNSRRRSEVQVFITPHITSMGVPLTAIEKGNAAAQSVEQTHQNIPVPRGSGLPRDPHGEPPPIKTPPVRTP